MSEVLYGALIGFSGTILVGFVSNFCAEDYRRHRDAVALAGALAGELMSYEEAWPMLENQLEHLRGVTEPLSSTRQPHKTKCASHWRYWSPVQQMKQQEITRNASKVHSPPILKSNIVQHAPS